MAKQTTILYCGVNEANTDISTFFKMRPSAFPNMGMLYSYYRIIENKNNLTWLKDKLEEVVGGK